MGKTKQSRSRSVAVGVGGVGGADGVGFGGSVGGRGGGKTATRQLRNRLIQLPSTSNTNLALNQAESPVRTSTLRSPPVCPSPSFRSQTPVTTTIVKESTPLSSLTKRREKLIGRSPTLTPITNRSLFRSPTKSSSQASLSRRLFVQPTRSPQPFRVSPLSSSTLNSSPKNNSFITVAESHPSPHSPRAFISDVPQTVIPHASQVRHSPRASISDVPPNVSPHASQSTQSQTKTKRGTKRPLEQDNRRILSTNELTTVISNRNDSNYFKITNNCFLLLYR